MDELGDLSWVGGSSEEEVLLGPAVLGFCGARPFVEYVTGEDAGMDSGDDGVDETWRLERFLLRLRKDFISNDGIFRTSWSC